MRYGGIFWSAVHGSVSTPHKPINIWTQRAVKQNSPFVFLITSPRLPDLNYPWSLWYSALNFVSHVIIESARLFFCSLSVCYALVINNKTMENKNIFSFFESFRFTSKIIISKCKIQTTNQEYIHGSVPNVYDTKTMFYLIFKIRLS